MLKKVVITLLTVFALITVPLSAVAQPQDAKRVEKERQVKQQLAKLGTGRSAVVKVKLYNDTEYKGYISRAENDQFELTDVVGTPHPINYSDVRSIGGRNLSSGAKLAIGIGIGAGVTLAILFAILAHLD